MTSRWLNRLITSMLLLVSFSVPIQQVSAQGRKFFVYNNTTRTDFTGVYMAPAGSENWGRNQALNDNDKVLDFGERLTLTGLSPGAYSVKLVDRSGRTCILQRVDLTRETSFEIRDNQLSNCH
jgi:hypothetical protein